jgi:hypothetical protein
LKQHRLRDPEMSRKEYKRRQDVIKDNCQKMEFNGSVERLKKEDTIRSLVGLAPIVGSRYPSVLRIRDNRINSRVKSVQHNNGLFTS